MKRREVWWVNFDPSMGGEIKKKRPAVIVSKERLFRRAGMLSQEDMRKVEEAIKIQLGIQ